MRYLRVLSLLLAMLLLFGCAAPKTQVAKPTTAPTEGEASPSSGVPEETETQKSESTVPETEAESASEETESDLPTAEIEQTEPSTAEPEETDPETTEQMTADPEETDPETTEPETTESKSEDPPENMQTVTDLTDDTVLFHKGLSDVEFFGECVPLQTVAEWAEEGGSFPRTHYYDEFFSDCEEILQLMDYSMSHGFTGFSVKNKPYCEKNLWYETDLLEVIYPIDCGFYTLSRDVTTGESGVEEPMISICLYCESTDPMEYFGQAMEKAEQIVAELPENADDWERADYLYAYLKKHTAYDPEGRDYYRGDWHCLYDALIGGKTVCTGYSEALYYLFNLAGVDCLVVIGTVEEEGGGHEWNMASLYGTYYCFDVTWDVRRMTGYVPYFFALSRDAMDLYSVREYYDFDDLLPPCDQCFLPLEEWTETPEGAFRSFLWYRNQASDLAAILLANTGLYTAENSYEYTADNYIQFDIPMEKLDALLTSCMMPKCCIKEFERELYQNRDGMIAAYGYYLRRDFYFIQSITQMEDGTYCATVKNEKGKESWFDFTVTEIDGRYLIDRVSHRTSP